MYAYNWSYITRILGYSILLTVWFFLQHMVLHSLLSILHPLSTTKVCGYLVSHETTHSKHVVQTCQLCIIHCLRYLH